MDEKKGEVKSKTTGLGNNSSGVAGVVFGVLSILSLSVGGILMGIVGLVFSMQQQKVGRNKWSKAGIILNIIGIIVGIIAIIFLINFATQYVGQLGGAQLPSGFG